MKLDDIAKVKPEKVVVKLSDTDGVEHDVDVYLRPLSFQLILREQDEENEDGLAEIIASRIAYSVCDENGKQLYTKEQCLGTAEQSLRSDIVLALAQAVGDFNGLSEKKMEPQSP